MFEPNQHKQLEVKVVIQNKRYKLKIERLLLGGKMYFSMMKECILHTLSYQIFNIFILFVL